MDVSHSYGYYDDIEEEIGDKLSIKKKRGK